MITAIKNITEKYYVYPLILFIFATAYMFFLTQGVPFFWDDHQFHQDFLSHSLFYWIKDIVLSTVTTLSLYDNRGIYALFVKVLFFIFDYNLDYYRLVKAGIFGIYISLVYLIAFRFTQKHHFSVILSFIPLVSFPLYIHTLVFDEPFIIMDVFKLIAFLCFLTWYTTFPTQKRYNWFIIGIAATFIATRTYITGYSIYATLGLFILFDKWKKIQECKLLLIGFLGISILSAVGGFLLIQHAAPHGISTFPFTHTFFPEWIKTALSPLITFDSLYYKPFSAMITFFGIWILLFSLLILIFSIIKKQLIPNNNKPLYFLCAWIISELPLWFVLPEHAIRYTSALIVPITLIGGILVSYALSCVHVSLKKYYVPLMMFLFIGICITHVGYSLAYRIGWGSSFIAMDTAAYYLAAYDPDAHATYYALSAGDEYLILTKEKGNYSISTTPRFIKTTDVTAFDNLIASKDSQAYILQRITPQGTAFPPLSLQQQNLQEIIRIKGTSTNGFDYLYLKICSWFKKTPLTSEVAIYHINEKKIQQK